MSWKLARKLLHAYPTDRAIAILEAVADRTESSPGAEATDLEQVDTQSSN